MWFYDDDNFAVINKECFGGKASIIFFVEKDGIPSPKFPDIPYEAEGVWMRFRVNGKHIVGEYRAVPTDPWHEVGNGELPVKGPPTVGFHAGYAPKKDLNRWASLSHFKIAELAKE